MALLRRTRAHLRNLVILARNILAPVASQSKWNSPRYMLSAKILLNLGALPSST